MSNTLIPIDTGLRKPYMLEITTHDVLIRRLPPPLHGATFVHLSDLHGGFGHTEPVFEAAIAHVNALQPDLLLFTGDYIDDHARPIDYPMQEILCRFHTPRLGVYGSFGNHDYRRGIVGTRRLLEKTGLRALCNESLYIEPGLWIAALDDLERGKPDIARAMQGVPEETTALLLSHNPRMIQQAGNYSVLMLSGHTHGGQIALPFPTPKMVCWMHLRCSQVAGWYVNGRARLYVSRGLGVTGKPFRYRCPAEIGVFRLLPDPQDTTHAENSAVQTVAR